MGKHGVLAMICILFVWVPVLAIGPGEGTLGDPYYPELGNSGYDALHYILEINTDVSSGSLEAVVTIEARAARTLHRFHLDFLGFTITLLTVNGQPADFERQGRELIISPVAPLPPDEVFTTVVAYRGRPREGTEADNTIRLSGGWVFYEDGVFVASQPDGASLWFPVNDHPLDKATYTFRITVPDGYVAAANGLLQEVLERPTTRTFVWHTEHPMASYLAAVHIADFVEQREVSPGGVLIRNYFPARIAEEAAEAFSDTAAMLDFFVDLFGPYPFEAYGVAMADTDLGFALETQTLSLFGRATEKNPNLDFVIAHELAHQWWGNSVSVASWQDMWLNEGFANYSAALWFEHSGGPGLLDNIMRNWYNSITDPEFAAFAVPVADPGPMRLFSRSVYVRGALTLHALRGLMGDEAFFELLRAYYARHAYGSASTADFIAAAGEFAGQDLSDFFNAWLYELEVPTAEFFWQP